MLWRDLGRGGVDVKFGRAQALDRQILPDLYVASTSPHSHPHTNTNMSTAVWPPLAPDVLKQAEDDSTVR